MVGLIDLHAHVLPGLDDGPATLEEALALLRAIAAQGVRVVVATPHGADGRYNAVAPRVLEQTAALQQAADEAGLGVRILPGMELLLGPDLVGGLRRGELLPLANTRWVCVELPRAPYPFYADRAFYELMLAGYRPVLVHPERNPGIQRRPEIMADLADRGVVGMITAGSLLGYHGPEARRLAEEFLRAGYAPLVASDAHGLHRRPPLLPQALAVAREFGKADQAAEYELLGITTFST